MLKLGLVGVGEIARKQHLPTIAAQDGLALVAAASHAGTAPGVPNYRDVDAMLDAEPSIEAVVLCVPPAVRYAAARTAIARGRHVFLEKPPGTTVAEVEDLAAQAEAAGVTLFASWHSRYAPAIAPARERLAATTIRSVSVPWKEDARETHPGQEWIWRPGGFGVFDPGINALSVLTHLMPRPFHLVAGTMAIPQDRSQPVSAVLDYVDEAGVPIRCDWDLDWRSGIVFEMTFETDAGRIVLDNLYQRLTVAGEVVVDAPEREYRALYDLFVGLVAEGRSDVDLAPLVHCADAYLAAERRVAPAWTW